MKDPKEQRRHGWTVVAIVGGGGIVLFLLVRNEAARGGPPARAGSAAPTRSASAQPSRHTLNFAPNPANPALEESMIQAREAALGFYDQSAVQEKSNAEQYQLGLNQDATAKAIAFNSNATQLKETGLTTGAEQAIAQEEAAAQQTIAQTEASAYQSVQSGAQSTSLWGSIIGGLTSIFPFLGSSLGPTGYGTGYVDPSGEPSLPPAYDLPGGDPYAALGMTPPLPPAYTGNY